MARFGAVQSDQGVPERTHGSRVLPERYYAEVAPVKGYDCRYPPRSSLAASPALIRAAIISVPR